VKLNVKAAAIALGSTVAVVFLLTSIVYTTFPGSIGLTAHLFHVDMTGIYRSLGPREVAIGTVVWWLFGAALGGAVAEIYNRVAGK